MTDGSVESFAAPVLSGHGISVGFGGIVALDEVDIEVPRNAIVGLIGPNGAGKTTLLGVLSGLTNSRNGQVSLDGADVTMEPAYQRARRGMARTFQQPELSAGLSVREHLVLSWRIRFDRKRMWRDLIDGRAWRKPHSDESERVDYLLERLGLSPLRNSAVSALPLGFSRLVEVGRALASSPRIVLLDEPLSGLDASESEALCTVLQELKESEGVSFLLVDHDADEVLARSSTVIVLDFGRIIVAGTPDEIRANEMVRTVYLGETVSAEVDRTNG